MTDNTPIATVAPLVEGKADTVVPRLALRPREAARALGICERTLWTMTQRGEVPCVRRGRAVLYPVDLLQAWLRAGAEEAGHE